MSVLSLLIDNQIQQKALLAPHLSGAPIKWNDWRYIGWPRKYRDG